MREVSTGRGDTMGTFGATARATIRTGFVPSVSAMAATSRANQVFAAISGAGVKLSDSSGHCRLPITVRGVVSNAKSVLLAGTNPRSTITTPPFSRRSKGATIL